MKIREKRISYRTLFIILAVALALLLLPMLVAAQYDVPSADDYGYGTPTHLEWQESGSILRVLAVAWEWMVDVWAGWQGTFSAIFLFSLQPTVFGEQYYFLTAYIMLAALVGGVFAVCRAVSSELFRLERGVGEIAACVAAALCVQLVPSPAEGFYWFNGSIYYTFFFGISLVALAMGIKLVTRGGGARKAALCVLAFFIGGGNFVTSLSSSILAVCAVGLLLILKDKRVKRLLLPAAFMLAGFFLSVAAPGNVGRQINTPHTPNAVQAILDSFCYGAKYGVEWLSFPLAGALLFLTVIFYNASAKSRIKFRLPVAAAISVFSYCLLSAMFCPTAYAQGTSGDYRVRNIIFFAYVLMAVFNCFYWAGWLRTAVSHAREERTGLSVSAAAILSAVFLICCAAFVKTGGGFTFIMTVGTLQRGEAQAYYACAQERLEILKDDEITDAELSPYPCQPYILFFGDISFNAEDWQNMQMSEFYGKNSVVLKAQD